MGGKAVRVALAAVVLVATAGCRSEPERTVVKQRSMATTTRIEPTRAGVIASIDAACKRFMDADSVLDHNFAEESVTKAFVEARREMLTVAVAALHDTPFPTEMADLKATVGQLLSGALALYDYNAASSGQLSIAARRSQAEDMIRQSAIMLYQAGATGCAPNALNSAAAPLSPEAGPLLPITPVATISLGPPGIDDNRIVAGDIGVWVGLRNTNEMVHVDPATNQVVARIAIGGSPTGLPAIVDGHVWVSTPLEILRIDPATNQIDRRYNRGDLGYGDSIDASIGSDVAYTCTERVLRAMNLADGSMRPNVAVSVPCYRVQSRGDEVWLMLGDNGRLTRVDPTTGAILAVVDVPGAAFYAFDDGTVRWALAPGGLVIRFDAETGKVLAELHRSGQATLQGTAGAGVAWLTADEERRILVVQPDGDELSLSEIAAGDGVNAVAYHDGTLWAANSDAGTVMRFDASGLVAGSG